VIADIDGQYYFSEKMQIAYNENLQVKAVKLSDATKRIPWESLHLEFREDLTSE
jgi:hypothetical protein